MSKWCSLTQHRLSLWRLKSVPLPPSRQNQGECYSCFHGGWCDVFPQLAYKASLHEATSDALTYFRQISGDMLIWIMNSLKEVFFIVMMVSKCLKYVMSAIYTHGRISLRYHFRSWNTTVIISLTTHWWYDILLKEIILSCQGRLYWEWHSLEVFS